MDNLVESEALKFLDDYEKEQKDTSKIKLKIKFNFKPINKLSSFKQINCLKDISIGTLLDKVIIFLTKRSFSIY